METVTDFLFVGSKISADGNCSHAIKRHLLLGRKAMTNLDSILKSRDITLPTKVLLVKAMVFPVVMYGCENWTVTKAEHWRIDAFKLWCWRRLLRVQLLEFTQTHIHRVGDAIQPSHPLSFTSPLAFNLSQHQGLFQWVDSSNQVATILELQL